MPDFKHTEEEFSERMAAIIAEAKTNPDGLLDEAPADTPETEPEAPPSDARIELQPGDAVLILQPEETILVHGVLSDYPLKGPSMRVAAKLLDRLDVEAEAAVAFLAEERAKKTQG